MEGVLDDMFAFHYNAKRPHYLEGSTQEPKSLESSAFLFVPGSQ